MKEDTVNKVGKLSNEQSLVSTTNSATKEYINRSKKLLEDFKMMQNVIDEVKGPEITILIKVAQKNLTESAIKQSDEMINEFQLDFNEDSVQKFIEQSITLITSVETANYLYGSIIDIELLRKYVSVKVTKQMIIRSNKLLEQLKVTNYEDKSRLTFVIENLNLSIKVFDYCWDIFPKNIKALQQSNVIVDSMITHKVKLGLDNYNIELLRIIIERNIGKITSIKANKNVKKETIVERAIESEEIAEGSFFAKFDFEENNIATAIVQRNTESITEKFIEMTDDIIKEVTESSSNDFMNIALQKFYSIIGAIETMNYLKGEIVNKHAVAQNISNLLTEMVYSNYTSLNKCWLDIVDKSPEDYKAYAKEVKKYCEILIESYNMSKDNIDALKKCLIIENDIFGIHEKFNFKKVDIDRLNTDIEDHIMIIKKTDSSFTLTRKIPGKQPKKKKSIWAKIFS